SLFRIPDADIGCPLKDGLQLRNRLFLCYAGSEAGQHAQAPPVGSLKIGFAVNLWRTPGIQFGTALERNPEVCGTAGFDAFEPLGRNADNGQRNAFDIECFSKHIRITREALRPIVVADYGNRGLLCTGLAYALFYKLIGNIGATRAAMVTYLVPAFGVAWGWLFLGEPLTPSMAVGGALILGGMIFGQRETPQQAHHPKPARVTRAQPCTDCG